MEIGQKGGLLQTPTPFSQGEPNNRVLIIFSSLSLPQTDIQTDKFKSFKLTLNLEANPARGLLFSILPASNDSYSLPILLHIPKIAILS